jgi:DNA-binding PadR family transcriptional regulator
MFEQAVLLSILSLSDDAYGRTVLQDAQQRLGRGVAAGAVYATLDRLEAKGLVRSTLAPGTPRRDGRVRRYYAVTASGVRALNESKRATERMWRGLSWPVKGRA